MYKKKTPSHFVNKAYIESNKKCIFVSIHWITIFWIFAYYLTFLRAICLTDIDEETGGIKVKTCAFIFKTEAAIFQT